jgi:hypothetical protein
MSSSIPRQRQQQFVLCNSRTMSPGLGETEVNARPRGTTPRISTNRVDALKRQSYNKMGGFGDLETTSTE